MTSELVILPVNVTDTNGNFIRGLSGKNFQVYEDNHPQAIAFFEQEDAPASIGLLVDHSGSMETKLSNVITAISAFARLSNPKDEISVVDFADTVSVELMGGKLFTSDPDEIVKAIETVSADGRTALYDAVAEGILRLQSGHWQKRALIIISDGGDDASRHNFSEIVELAQRSQVTIYAVGLVDESGEEQNPRVLDRLSKETGGIAFFPSSPEGVVDSAVRIAGNLRQQYMLGYVPGNLTPGKSYRKIQVRVVAAGLKGARVKTRPGYSITP